MDLYQICIKCIFGHIYGYISLSMWFLMQSLQTVVEMESLGVFYKIWCRNELCTLHQISTRMSPICI